MIGKILFHTAAIFSVVLGFAACDCDDLGTGMTLFVVFIALAILLGWAGCMVQRFTSKRGTARRRAARW